MWIMRYLMLFIVAAATDGQLVRGRLTTARPGGVRPVPRSRDIDSSSSSPPSASDTRLVQIDANDNRGLFPSPASGGGGNGGFRPVPRETPGNPGQTPRPTEVPPRDNNGGVGRGNTPTPSPSGASSPLNIARRQVQERKRAEDQEVQNRKNLRTADANNQIGNQGARRVLFYLAGTKEVRQVADPASVQLKSIKQCSRRGPLNSATCAELFERMNNGLCEGEFVLRLPPQVGPDGRPNPAANRALPDDGAGLYDCPLVEKPVCRGDTEKYRTFDGTCNNRRYLLAGSANRAMTRNLPAAYDDCISEVRKAKSGRDLPSARVVSQNLYAHRGSMSHVITTLLMSFAQLLDHDTDHTPVSTYTDPHTGEAVDIECGVKGCETEGLLNEHCLPITIPRTDNFFNQRETPCLHFVRSQEYLKDHCQSGPREQPNQITSWLDASFLYGSGNERHNSLREYRGGRMKMVRHPLRDTGRPRFKDLLPMQDDEACRNATRTHNCFRAGDSRQNTQVGLQAFHTIFARYHNYIAEKLAEKHRYKWDWDDNKIFEETRKILVAVWQHIVYNEFLPIVLGQTIMAMFDLRPRKEYYYTGYNDDIDVINPDVTSEFSTAAYRFGHSLVGDKLRFADFTYQETKEVSYTFALFNPTLIYYSGIRGNQISGINAFTLGAMQQKANEQDIEFTTQITNSLFTDEPPKGKGMDLPALNTQRGRDHGLQGYNEWREWCKNLLSSRDRNQLVMRTGRVRSFDDLLRAQRGNFESDVLRRFRETYEHVDDIDLFPGGQAEESVYGGLVGPTFACIIAHQFTQLKRGDRFYYENVEYFDLPQLTNIREQTLSSILCATLEDDADFYTKPRTTLQIQKYAMLQTRDVAVRHLVGEGAARNGPDIYSVSSLYKDYRENNHLKFCKDLPNLDFDLF